MKTVLPGLLKMPVVRGCPPGPPPPPSVFMRKVFALGTTLIFCKKRFLAVLVRLIIFGGLGSTCKHMRANGETEGRRREKKKIENGFAWAFGGAGGTCDDGGNAPQDPPLLLRETFFWRPPILSVLANENIFFNGRTRNAKDVFKLKPIAGLVPLVSM